MKQSHHGKANVLWLVAMVLFTPVVGMCLNYLVFNPRSIVVLLAWTAILIAPYVITHWKTFYYFAASLIFVDGFINLFHWIILKCPLNASSIFVFLNTNYDEATEFMTIKLTPWLLLLVPYIAIFVMVLRRVPLLNFKKKGEIVVWSLLWLFSCLFFADNIVHKRFLRLAVPDVEQAFAAFFEESREYSSLEKRELFDLDTEVTTNDSTLVVVIIGESCNRNHMSLYGYHRETSPRLKARNDIFVFDNVISANSNTLNSLMLFLTENNTEHHNPIDSCIHIFDVFHNTPSKSFWLSNQSPLGLWENGVTNLARNADVKTYVNVMASSSMASTQMPSYDESLFTPFIAAIDDTAKHKIVFLHLMGCHTQYSKRYPRRFEKFKGSNDKRGKIVDSYDNAVFYNDYVVDSLLSILAGYSRKHSDIRVSALYFSDHGENVYDEGDYCGHDYSDRIPHANVEIPFILWFSPLQLEQLKTCNVHLEERLHAPYMIDDLFHTIIDMGNVATPCFDPTRSFLKRTFDPERKRILEDVKGY